MTADGPSIPKVASKGALGPLSELLRGQYGALARWQSEYGGVFSVDLGPAQFVLVTNASAAAEMLIERGQEFTRAGNLYKSMKAVFGEVSMITSDGPEWRTRRRLAQPHFRQRALGIMSTRVASTVEELIDTLKPGPQDVYGFTGQLAMSVALSVLFGRSLSKDEADRLAGAVDFVITRIGVGWVSQKLPAWLPIPGRRRFRREMEHIDDVLNKLIETRLANGDLGDDVFGMLLHMAEAGNMSVEDIRNEAVGLIIAGYETTGNAMAWGLHELAQAPELQARVRAEADALDPDTVSEPASLAYTRRVFQETLRKYPSAIWLPRNAIEDTQLCGYPIPEGTAVMCSTYLVHRDPNEWPDPDRFDPERFAEGAEPRSRFAYMPFGLGQHMCIGQHLAMLEGALSIARIVQQWDLSVVPDRTCEPKISTSMNAKDGVWLDLRARTRAEN